MAHLAETVATMSWDSGLGAVAQTYYRMALRSAKEAGDRAFGAHILAGMARQLLYLGRADDALELVHIAQDGLRHEPAPRVSSMLYTREAWSYAAAGRAGAFRRATANAESIFPGSPTSVEPNWISYFDEAELNGVTGGRLLELAHREPAHAAEAAAHIDRAIGLRDTRSLRSLALDQLGLAEAHILLGQLEEASRLGHMALDTVSRTHSDRVRVKSEELLIHLNLHQANHPLAELKERLTYYLRSNSSD
jgi:tetratricopeptide (TPR) repeat protein